jgi:hypothetical protein
MVAVAVVVNWFTRDADSKPVTHDDDVRAGDRQIGPCLSLIGGVRPPQQRSGYLSTGANAIRRSERK